MENSESNIETFVQNEIATITQEVADRRKQNILYRMDIPLSHSDMVLDGLTSRLIPHDALTYSVNEARLKPGEQMTYRKTIFPNVFLREKVGEGKSGNKTRAVNVVGGGYLEQYVDLPEGFLE